MSPIQSDRDRVHGLRSYAPDSTCSLGWTRPLDVSQQVYALPMAANTVNNSKGTQNPLQVLLQTELPAKIAVISNQWEVVWGPVVWKAKLDDPITGPDRTRMDLNCEQDVTQMVDFSPEQVGHLT
ncbi:hypothetical protein M405DRAFT_928549 [Rhizopogon salebrosus TDB-379]|nr:hypothetical protein M405DRAFT_928549 [Rhizopogon salebrosus TDB-379]